MAQKCGKLIAFAGRSSFNSLMSQVIGISLIKDGNTFTAATFGDSSTWQTLIAGKSGGMKALPLSIKRGFENTTPEVAVEESNLGFKEQTSTPVPSLKGYLDGNFCDYKELNSLNGAEFDVVLHLKDGGQVGTKESSSTIITGMKATVQFYFGLPLAENRMQSYPIWVNFESYDEFTNLYVINPTYTLRTLLGYIPVGLSMETTVALSSSTATVRITKRSDSTPMTGLTTTDFTVLQANASDVAVTSLTESGGGYYVLTIQKDASGTPADLASGEYAIIQATEDDGTNYTYVSNAETFTQ